MWVMTPLASDRSSVEVRPYKHGDAADTLAIFLAAVTETASADYTAEQIQAWAAPEARGLDRWGAAMLNRGSFVAIVGGQMAGFSDVGGNGYVDMMFVAPTFLRRGVATKLLAHGENLARARNVRGLSADVSVTARPFFESQGFVVVTQQHPVKRGVTLTNFKMRKCLE